MEDKITRREVIIRQVAEIKAGLADALGRVSELTETLSNSLIIMDDIIQDLMFDKDRDLDAIFNQAEEPEEILPLGNQPEEPQKPTRLRQAPPEQPETLQRAEARQRIKEAHQEQENPPETARMPLKQPEQAPSDLKSPTSVEKVLGTDKDKAEKMRERQETIAKLEEELRRLQKK